MNPRPLGHAVLDVVQAVPAAAEAWALLRRIPRLPEASGPRRGLAGGPAGAVAQSTALTLLVLGESTAAGVGAPTQESALGGRLAEALAAHSGHPVRWQVAGQNGATIRRIRHRLLAEADEAPIDVAVIAAGANDVMRGRSTAEWEEHLRAIAGNVRGAAGGGETLVVLTGVPPFSHCPALRRPLRDYLARRAARIDARSAELCRELGILFLPFIEGEMELADDFFAEDQFHPSATGYALWAEYIAAHIADRLRADTESRTGTG